MQFQKPSGNNGQRSDLLTIYDVVCAVLNLPDGSKFFCGGSFNQARLDPHGCALHKWQTERHVMDYRVRAGDWRRFYTDGTEQARNASKVIEHVRFYLGSLKCFWSKK